jgi:uncharacterized protein with ParB-like and HNH nuclease domain
MSRIIYDDILEVRGSGNSAHYLIAPKTVQQFFSMEVYSRRIPEYQRPYSWEKSNILDLIKDVVSASEKKKPWFLGPIFTTVVPASKYRISNLLDGQQRITTIQLILLEAYVIRYAFEPPLDQKSLGYLDELNKTLLQVLQQNDNGTWVPIFIPDPSIKDVFKDYFDSVFKVKSHKEWEDLHDELKAKSKLDWITGFETFKMALFTIREELIVLASNSKNQADEDSIKHFVSIVNKLLYDCWVIEIPLQKEEYVLDIFESLNNRGKPLSLTDILKFKSFTIGQSSAKITELWSTLFQNIDHLENLGLVSDEDDFFKYLLNTYSKEDLTDNKDLVNFFTSDICRSENEVVTFLQNTIKLCVFLKDLYGFDDTSSKSNQFSVFIGSPLESKRFRILVSLFKFAHKSSDNIRFPLFYFARKIKVDKSNIDTVFQFLLDLSRAVIYNVVFFRKKSNTIRNDFHGLINDFEGHGGTGKLAFRDFMSDRKWDDLQNLTYNYNLAHVEEPQYANLIMAFNQCFDKDPGILINYSQTQYKDAQCEHLFPIMWKKNWSTYSYTKSDIEKYMKELPLKPFYQSLKYKSKEDLVKKMNLNLLEMNTLTVEKRNHLDNTVVEFIGNKWLLNKALNSKQKNFGFPEKKNVLEQHKSGFLMIPRFEDPMVGIAKYDIFTYKEIIERTLNIVDMLVSNFNKKVGDIKPK